MTNPPRVLIVGAGPTGLACALGLARTGADVTVIDREADVVASPRATVYVASTLKVIDELGLLAEARQIGAETHEFNMRFKLTGNIASMDHRIIADLTPYAYTLHFGQDELAYMAIRALTALSNARVHFNAEFAALRQEGSVVSVDIQMPTGPQHAEFDWVIGADGARSSVRSAIGVEFQGFTWPETFMATNVHYDFAAAGWASSNMVADAANWHVVARLNRQEHFWRISYAEAGDVNEEERLARIPERYANFLPEPKSWQLARANSYRVHQRSAATYRVGRVLLAGDAAHATSPIGGMGLASGIQDASTLIRCLSALFAGEAGGDIVDYYAYERRRVFLEIANPTAIEFKRRVSEADRARRLQDEADFMAVMKDRDLQRGALMSVFQLCGRPYREDWRELFVREDAQHAGKSPLVLGADSADRIANPAQ